MFRCRLRRVCPPLLLQALNANDIQGNTETVMKPQKNVTTFALRNTARLAWALADAAATLRAIGECLKRWVDAHATRRGIDTLAAIEPLTQQRAA
jgi:hypothetical protein